MTCRRLWSALGGVIVALIGALALGACSGRSSTSPTILEALRPTEPLDATGITWTGSIEVQSMTGNAGTCEPASWNPGFVDTISVTLLDEQCRYETCLLWLRQPATGEACKMVYAGTDRGIDAVDYYRDPMDERRCASQVRQLDCSAEARSHDPHLRADFGDASRTRLIGTLEMPYMVATGNGGWSHITIVRRFDIQKAP